MRVLVIEDETKVGSFIKRALEEESYAVDLCEDGAQGLDMALSGSYDLIMIDLMLPSLPGLEVLTRLRKEKIQTSGSKDWMPARTTTSRSPSPSMNCSRVSGLCYDAARPNPPAHSRSTISCSIRPHAKSHAADNASS